MKLTLSAFRIRACLSRFDHVDSRYGVDGGERQTSVLNHTICYGVDILRRRRDDVKWIITVIIFIIRVRVQYAVIAAIVLIEVCSAPLYIATRPIASAKTRGVAVF